MAESATHSASGGGSQVNPTSVIFFVDAGVYRRAETNNLTLVAEHVDGEELAEGHMGILRVGGMDTAIATDHLRSLPLLYLKFVEDEDDFNLCVHLDVNLNALHIVLTVAYGIVAGMTNDELFHRQFRARDYAAACELALGWGGSHEIIDRITQLLCDNLATEVTYDLYNLIPHQDN
ncbi:hypothetical protein F5Y05DRAFT_419843 [Hypoxylon sp. FL0543]|nr:hypothetical protein F5Y05DRAFT_419843 [Hypoxylon sp. FL0543]